MFLLCQQASLGTSGPQDSKASSTLNDVCLLPQLGGMVWPPFVGSGQASKKDLSCFGKASRSSLPPRHNKSSTVSKN